MLFGLIVVFWRTTRILLVGTEKEGGYSMLGDRGNTKKGKRYLCQWFFPLKKFGDNLVSGSLSLHETVSDLSNSSSSK